MARRRQNGWKARVYTGRAGGQPQYEQGDFFKDVDHGGSRAARKAAEAQEAVIKAKLAQGRQTKTPTVEEWVERFTREFTTKADGTQLRASSLRNRADQLKGLVEHFGERGLHEISRDEAHAYVVGDYDKDGSPLWTNRWRAPQIKACFATAVDLGLVDRNPFARLRIPTSPGRRDIVVITLDEVLELAGVARKVHGPGFGDTFSAAIVVAAYVGIRPSELFGLFRLDARSADNELDVLRQIYKGSFGPPKNGWERAVVLPPAASDAVRSLPVIGKTQVDHKQRSGALLFPAPGGDAITGSQLTYHFKPVRAAWGRPDFDFYELRHFCGHYHYVQLGLPAEDVAYQLGHTDGGKLVRDLYGHGDQGALDRIKRAHLAGPAMDINQYRDRKRGSL